MQKSETYIVGKSKIPTWVGNVMSAAQYDRNAQLIEANISTNGGIKTAKKGDVLMRIDGDVVMITQNDAKKYGVIKGGKKNV